MLIIILVSLSIPATALLFLQNNKIQTKLTQRVIKELSEQLQTHIQVEDVSITFFNRFLLKDILIEDLAGDTLLYSKKVKVTLNSFNKRSPGIQLKKLSFDGADIHLITSDSPRINLQFIIDNLKQNQEKKKNKEKKIFTLKKIELENSRFRLTDKRKDTLKKTINFAALDLSDLKTKVEDLYVYRDTVSFLISGLKFTEKTGFKVENLSSKFNLTKKYLYFNNFLARTPYSNVSANEIHFDFDTFRDFSDFINRVKINMNFRSSSVNFRDLGYFTPGFTSYNERIRISGLLAGTINQLSASKVLFAYNNHTILGGSFNLIGLPDFEETFMHFNINLFQTNIEDLKKLRLPGKKQLTLSDNFSKLGTLTYEGKFTGYYDDFVAYGVFGTDLGNISTDILLKPDTTGGMRYRGRIKTPEFQIGKIIEGEKQIAGGISVSANVDGSVVDKIISGNLKGKIDSFDLFGYTYRNIQLSGFLGDKTFDGSFRVKDPNIQMDFNGKVDFSTDLPSFRFTADVGRLRPYFLNVNKTDPSYFASFLVKSDFSGIHPDKINGSVHLINSFFQRSDKQLQIYDLELLSKNKGDSSLFSLRSDVLDADLIGNYKVSSLPNSFKALGNKIIPSYISSPPVTKEDNNNFTLSINFRKIENVLNFFLPDLLISDNSSLAGKYNAREYNSTITAYFPRVGFKNNIMNDLYLIAETDSVSANITGWSKEFYLGKDLNISNFQANGNIFNDTVYSQLTWENSGTPTYKGDINTQAVFSENAESKNKIITIKTIPSHIVYNDTLWNLSETEIRIDSSYLGVDSFTISNNNQSIVMNGEISENRGSGISLFFTNLDLNNLSLFTRKHKLDFEGFLNGQASLYNAYTNPVFLSGLTMEKFHINGQDFGAGKLNTKWDQESKAVHMLASGIKNETEIFRLQGDFFPDPGKIKFNLDFDKIRLSTFEPFTQKLISDLKGLGSGNLAINGSLKKPEVFGNIEFFKASTLINYLQTRYSFTDGVSIIDNNILLNNFMIHDENGSTAIANGMVSSKYFRNFNIDLNLSSSDFLFLDTSPVDNEMFYGKVLAAGMVKINGPPDNLFMDINATTGRNSTFSIPLNGTEEVNENDFIRFITQDKHTNTYRQEPGYDFNSKGLNMNFNLEITPDAEVQLIFDPKVGDILRGKGTGNLNMAIRSNGEFEMYGEMTIEEGDYLFTLQNLINKKLEVEPGGSIRFNGDPTDAILDLKAVYKLRTSVYPLSPESGDDIKKRIPVECQISMTGKLMEPTIQTDIVLPTADQETQNILTSTINTEEEKLKQFISLLVLNNFMSIDPGASFLSNSATGSTASVAGVATSELLSNQLSHWLSQISRDFDIGLNYRPGDEITNDELEVALSTQILDDRITINGNLGVGGTGTTNASSTTNTNNIVGDFDIDFKLTENGKLHLKAFNRANDNLLFQTSPYTQGVGVFYREDFNSFSELIQKYFASMGRILKKTEEPKE